MMITPATYDLTIQRGDDFSFAFDIDVNGATLSLTGATVLSQIREGKSSSSTLIDSFTCTINGNEITLSLTDSETSAITASSGYYDVMVAIGTETTHYLGGTVAFLGTVTKVIA